METSLFCKSIDEISRILDLEKPFYARIVKENLIKGITDFEKMTSLPKAVRERLKGSALSTSVQQKMESESAVKLLLRLSDGEMIECVRLSDGKDRYTACLSSQVGCAMGCSFCKTGTMGLIRNLREDEIVEQFAQLEMLGERISHIVFMGMGEPLNNLSAVLQAIEYIHKEENYNISLRRITISTCGIVPGIRELSEVNLPIKLAVSLVSANDSIRSRIMKVNRAYGLSELKKALISFQKRGNKRITLEYCMLSGVNTDKESAAELRKFISGMDALVNLIEWNEIDTLDYRSPSRDEVSSFTDELKRLKINYTIRRSKGRDSSSACGMLATSSRSQIS